MLGFFHTIPLRIGVDTEVPLGYVLREARRKGSTP